MGRQNPRNIFAFVTYGDGSTDEYELPPSSESQASLRGRGGYMQNREPTCRVDGPRCKKALGDATVRPTSENGGPTCRQKPLAWNPMEMKK